MTLIFLQQRELQLVTLKPILSSIHSLQLVLTHMLTLDETVATTIRDILRTPEKQITARKTKAAKKLILHLTSPEYKTDIL